jgi:hypothetical protein
MILLGTVSSAQDPSYTLKITDIQGNTTLLTRASSSSSTSCNSPDFPVLRGGDRKDVDFRDLSWFTVVHDKPAKDPDFYINVELTLKNGSIEAYEMIKNIRFTGTSGEGDFNIEVKDINTVQIQ